MVWSSLRQRSSEGAVKVSVSHINPIYVGLERSCPRNTKNVSYDGIGLV